LFANLFQFYANKWFDKNFCFFSLGQKHNYRLKVIAFIRVLIFVDGKKKYKISGFKSITNTISEKFDFSAKSYPIGFSSMKPILSLLSL
jgi:hypothetical protein